MSETHNSIPGPDPILADARKQDELLGLVALGMSLKKACLYVGILDLKTLRHYRDRNPDFDQQVTRAELKGEIWHLNNWRKGAEGGVSADGHEVDWRASMEFLARKYPDDWAKRDKHEFTGPGGGPIRLESRESLDRLSLEELEKLNELQKKMGLMATEEEDVEANGG